MSRLRDRPGVVVVGDHAVPHVGQASREGQPDPFAPGADADLRRHFGFGRSSGTVDAEEASLKARFVLDPHAAADLDGLLQLGETHRRSGEVVAVGLVFVLAPACTDAEHEPAAAEHVQRGGHLGGEGGRTVATAQDVMAQRHVVEAGRQPGKNRPCLHERVGSSVEAVEMVGDPQRVEMGQSLRQDVVLLVHHDGLVVAPAVADNRRQPAELQFGHSRTLARPQPAALGVGKPSGGEAVRLGGQLLHLSHQAGRGRPPWPQSRHRWSRQRRRGSSPRASHRGRHPGQGSRTSSLRHHDHLQRRHNRR